MIRFVVFTLVAIALAACASSPRPAKPAASGPGGEARVGTPSWLKPSEYHAGGPVPEMQPNRAISDQDCTHGVQLTAGNLRCKEAR